MSQIVHESLHQVEGKALFIAILLQRREFERLELTWKFESAKNQRYNEKLEEILQ
jgi:hypothetical protein